MRPYATKIRRPLGRLVFWLKAGDMCADVFMLSLTSMLNVAVCFVAIAAKVKFPNYEVVSVSKCVLKEFEAAFVASQGDFGLVFPCRQRAYAEHPQR